MNEKSFLFDAESNIKLDDFLDAINSMNVGFSIADAKQEDLPLIYINTGFLKMTGYTRDEVIGRNCRFLQGEDTNLEHVEMIKTAIAEKRAESVILKNYRKDGTSFFNQFIISPIFDKQGELTYYIGLQFDVTKDIQEKQETINTITELSSYDQLTGLLNVQLFKRKLEVILRNNNYNGAILRVNLNRFRNINNSYGEVEGDKIIVEVANRLRSIFPPDTLICRSFADDFIIKVTTNTQVELAGVVASIEESLKKTYELNGEAISIDYSVGISRFPEDGIDSESLLKNAALAMREVKNMALTNHLYFTDTLLTKLEKRMRIESKFVRALENNEFMLHFQPKVKTDTKELIGMEALLRWEDQEAGMISPVEFIPIAEDTGFILPLGEWVLLEACQKNKEWQDQGGYPVPISVNVSAVQFNHPHFTDMVKKVLATTGLEPKYLELEVTESLLNNPRVIIEQLNKIKKIGVKISIDDFGTGYSSINYLKVLPVDTLKIDRAFVMGTPVSDRDNALLQSIIQLGKSLGLSVLAEGVETEEQFSFLSENGCDSIQGYYYSRPVDETTMKTKLMGVQQG